MSLRLIHTSDWHLGQHFYGKSRAQEHQAFLRWLLEQIEQQQVDALIVAGDIFDTGTPPSYARELYFNFIVGLQALNCTLVVVAGNHDSVAMLGESASILEKLDSHVITAPTINEQHQLITINTEQGEQAVICAIPFLRPRDVLESVAGQSAQEKQQALSQSIANHYQSLVEHAKEGANDNTAIIATGHLTTVGASVSESVRDIYIGTLEAFPAALFPEVDYLALGHIHRQQKVGGTEHIQYSGSPIALSFDEKQTNKSVNLVTFDQGKVAEIKQLAVPCVQPMLTVSCQLDDLAEKLTQYFASQEPIQNELGEEVITWLDVELESADYLHDLTAKVEAICAEFPVEVLLVRRVKKQRNNTSEYFANQTLEELTVDQVFQARVEREDGLSHLPSEQVARVSSLFEQMIAEVEVPSEEQLSNQLNDSE